MIADSKSQELAWELKKDAWREVEHLPIEEALAERLRRSAATVVALGLEDRVRDPRIRIHTTPKGSE